LDSGVFGYSAEEVVSEDCRYVTFSDGGWDWPLWKWKGPIVSEGGCLYGKFFANVRADVLPFQKFSAGGFRESDYEVAEVRDGLRCRKRDYYLC